ncbi:MAG: BMC domain-containing protein [Planctomycetes bacterium]|nr:BMC domain-containing protein [Planctomycetota bacterium]
MNHPAIGMIETNSIARGILVHDVMLKKAQIEVIQSNSICPGKYIVFIAGKEADVQEAMQDGLHYGGVAVIDSLYIPNIREDIFPAMIGGNQDIEIDSVVIVETYSVSSSIILSDMALKRNNVKLLDLRLAQGLGGKAYFIITGRLDEVEESAAHLKTEAEPGMLTNIEIIAAPHQGLCEAIGGRIL